MPRKRTGDSPKPATPSPPVPAGGGVMRRYQSVCTIHGVTLSPTGYCTVGEAFWYPKFACPKCAGPLWDNGFCENCTPKTGYFEGDYFEQRWGNIEDRAYGHYVRVHGPAAVPGFGFPPGGASGVRRQP